MWVDLRLPLGRRRRPLLPPALHGRLGLAAANKVYSAYCPLLASERWRNLAGEGARSQRVLWASTSTKDPTFPDTCLGCLAAPGTIDTVPERTLLAFAEHGNPDERLKPDQALAEATIAQIPAAVIDVDGLAEQLQRQVAGAFTADWAALLEAMTAKVDQLRRT